MEKHKNECNHRIMPQNGIIDTCHFFLPLKYTLINRVLLGTVVTAVLLLSVNTKSALSLVCVNHICKNHM